MPLLEQRDRTRALVASANDCLEDQRKLVASLSASKLDTTQFEKVLHLMEDHVRALQEHLASIERCLTNLPPSKGSGTSKQA